MKPALYAASAVAFASLTLADCPTQRLLGPADLSAVFGGEIAVNDRFMVFGDVGALSLCPGGDPFACKAGAIYAFERDGSDWFLTQTIIPPDIGFVDGFGNVVALDPANPDRFLTVTAGKLGDGELGYGHVFEHDGERWAEVARLPRPAGGGTGSYGSEVALHGDTALVSQSANVYRYREVSGEWIHEQTIVRPPEVTELGSFGYEGMALHGEWAFVSAHRDKTTGSPHGSPQHGSVMAYNRQPDGSLEYVQRLLPPDLAGSGEKSVQFGVGLDFDGTTLAVGARVAEREFESQGVVYLYELDGDTWTLRQELVSSLPRFRAVFGQGVSVDGDRLIAGHGKNSLSEAFAFRRGADGVWREVAVLRPSDGGPALPLGFGQHLALHGRWAVVGARNEDPGGAAYAYDLACFDCPADLDTDGTLTIFDFLAFFNAFDAGDPIADFDGDGELTIFDFLAFQTAFDAGCA